MQLSNGLSDPIGLWLGHLLFDSVFAVIVATLVVIVFAAASNQFSGLGFFVSPLSVISLGCNSCSRALSVGRSRAIWHRGIAVRVLRVAHGRFSFGGIRDGCWIPSHHVRCKYSITTCRYWSIC